MTNLDAFTTAYIECALWSSTDDDGEPLDSGDYELADETRDAMIADCAKFQAECDDWIIEAETEIILNKARERAGHDFWLTRCGHGAGFWDGDWPEPYATYLTDASERFGEVDLYIGDDGLIYQSP